jgi:hypothetical protein
MLFGGGDPFPEGGPWPCFLQVCPTGCSKDGVSVVKDNGLILSGLPSRFVYDGF